MIKYILEILVCKIQPEIIKSIPVVPNKIYIWLYFVYQNFQKGYFRISLRTIRFEVISGKLIYEIYFVFLCQACLRKLPGIYLLNVKNKKNRTVSEIYSPNKDSRQILHIIRLLLMLRLNQNSVKKLVTKHEINQHNTNKNRG